VQAARLPFPDLDYLGLVLFNVMVEQESPRAVPVVLLRRDRHRVQPHQHPALLLRQHRSSGE
jgi:hypothetical protein